MKKRTGVRTTSYSIFSYWKSQGEIDAINSKDSDMWPVCFACGKSFKVSSCYKIPMSRWNYAHGVQKHHIVPYSQGGSDDPSNLVLLCKRCHEAIPDVFIYKEPTKIQIDWINDRESYCERVIRKTKAFLDHHKATEKDMSSMANILIEDHEQLLEYMKNHSTLHYGESLKLSTFLEGLYAFYKTQQTI